MNHIRNHFPFLAEKNQIIYLDNAASTHCPTTVLDAMYQFSAHSYAPVHRSIYERSEQATQQFETVRHKVAAWLHAHPDEIVFTKGTTDSINMVAHSWGTHNLKSGDEILMPESEHHALLLAWRHVAQTVGAHVRYIPMQPDTILDGKTVQQYFTERTKIVCLSHTSHVFGTQHDIASIIERAHTHSIRVFIDAAQAVAHQKLNIAALHPDFLAFSAHKMFGPTGLGILYLNRRVQQETPPAFFGGGMVYATDFDTASWQKAPWRYEAGTPPITQVIGLGATLDFLAQVDYEVLRAHEAGLCAVLLNFLQTLPGTQIYGNIPQLKHKGHLVSFTLPGIHHHDVGSHLDAAGIAVRTGHLCAQPVVQKLGIPGLIRVSFGLYNTLDEVQALLTVLNSL